MERDGRERLIETRSIRHLVDSGSTIMNAEAIRRQEHTRNEKRG